MKSALARAPPKKYRSPGTEEEASKESGMWSMHEELVVPRDTQEPLVKRLSEIFS